METSISASSAAATNYFASQTSATHSANSQKESTTKIIETAVQSVAAAKEPTTQELKVLVNDGNRLLKDVNSSLQFQIDDSTKHVVVKIVDSKTGDVIRQIPTVEMLDFIRHMKELEGNAGALLKAVA